jgi:PAS domain S-box-containing protein
MEKGKKNIKQLLEELEELRIRLEEAEETLSAIRSGEVDAIVVSGPQGDQVFTLTGAERAYRVLIETMNEGATSLNQEGLIIYCNQRLSEMIKTPLEKVIGAPMRQFIRASDLPVFNSLMEKGLLKSGKGEVAFIKNDGTVLPVLLSVSALQRDNTNVCSIVVTDLTAQKHIEEELRRHRDNLEELVKDRTNELETSNQQLQKEITERKRAEKALQERVKELGCINDISRLAEKPWVSIEEFMQGVVNILSLAWQYPEICCARIMLDSKEFKTANFRKTEWSQVADIKVDRKKFGAVTICYLEEKPATDEGPFLKEERRLINTVADFLGHIIQHRLSEAEIRASEEKFRIIFDNANDGILLADTESKKFYFANVTICHMLGYSQEEIKNMGVMDIHPEKDIPYVIEQFEKQSRKEIIVVQDLPVKRKDGSVFYADVNSALVEIEGKRYLLGIFRDITERKQAEEELRGEKNFIEDALNSLSDIFFVLDLNGKFLRWNKTMNAVSGYSDAEISSMQPADFFLKEDRQRVMEAIEIAVKYSYAIVEATVVTKNGRNIPFEFTGSLLTDLKKNPFGVCGVGRDITERKQAVEELHKREKELRKRVKELEEFYNMSVGRELRMIELKKEIERLNEEMARYKKDA